MNFQIQACGMNSGGSISFEPPFYPICVERRGVLMSESESVSRYVDFAQLGLEQMPDVITCEDVTYKYSGVQDGRAVYRETHSREDI